MHEIQKRKSTFRFSTDTRENVPHPERAVLFAQIQRDRQRQADKTIIHGSRQLYQSWEEGGGQTGSERTRRWVPVSNYYSRVCLPTSGNDLTGRSVVVKTTIHPSCLLLHPVRANRIEHSDSPSLYPFHRVSQKGTIWQLQYSTIWISIRSLLDEYFRYNATISEFFNTRYISRVNNFLQLFTNSITIRTK